MVIEVNNTNTADDDDNSIDTTNITPIIDNSSSDNTVRSSTEGAAASIDTTSISSIYEEEDDALRAWEIDTGKKIPQYLVSIAKIAYNLHHKENRGLTRKDVVELGYTKSTAKKIMYECQSTKLLIHVDGYKQGRYKQYFLATEIERFTERQELNKKNSLQRQLTKPELSVIQILINEITGRRPTFHKFMMHINISKDKTILEFDNVYHNLTTKDEWIVKSQNNRAKVKSFRLDYRRSCTLQIYPNGKIIVALECTHRPFKLNETDGCREFFETVGKIHYILSQEFMGYSIIPHTGEWLLKQYDRDITIPDLELASKYPYIKHWYSSEGVKIKTLGHVFQIYGKIMPICGKCLRIEDQITIKEDVHLEQGIEEAVKRPFEIASALDL